MPPRPTRPNSVRCFLFGHTGSEEESGYHVCSRCGLHDYHDSDAYQNAGHLTWPIFSRIHRFRQWLPSLRTKYNHNPEVPF